MERKTRRKIKWHKQGGGSFHMRDGRIIKPNQKFEAYPEDIPDGFRDVVVPLEPLPEDEPLQSATEFELQQAESPASLDEKQEGQAKYEIQPQQYEKQERDTSGWFDVVDSEGNHVNKKALREDEAENLIEHHQLWNVVEITSGKPMNDKSLSRTKAEQLYEALRN